MVLTDEMLAELERLDREATPGPWAIQDLGGWWQVAVNGDEMLVFDDGTAGGEYSPSCGASDRDFIIAARNALPDLIAEVRRLREWNARLHERALVAEEMTSKLHALMQRDETCAVCGRPTMAGEDFGGPCVEESAYDCAIRQRDEARAALAQARRDGAAEMRERAADVVMYALTAGLLTPFSARRAADGVRALPLPGEGP